MKQRASKGSGTKKKKQRKRGNFGRGKSVREKASLAVAFCCSEE